MSRAYDQYLEEASEEELAEMEAASAEAEAAEAEWHWWWETEGKFQQETGRREGLVGQYEVV